MEAGPHYVGTVWHLPDAMFFTEPCTGVVFTTIFRQMVIKCLKEGAPFSRLGQGSRVSGGLLEVMKRSESGPNLRQEVDSRPDWNGPS